MKKLGKLRIHNFHEMNEFEMKSIVGGYTSEPGYNSYNSGCPESKIDACAGKGVNNYCCHTYNSKIYKGRCLEHAPNYTLHCSNLY